MNLRFASFVILLGATARAEAPQPAPTAAATAPAAEITHPRFVSGPNVPYPKGQTVDAVVELKLRLSAEGKVDEALVLSGAEPFSTLALGAAQELLFEPALRGGRPVASIIRFRMEFRAPREEPPGPPPSRAANVPPPSAEKKVAEAPIEISVVGRKTPGSTRFISDAEAQIVPGAEGDPVRAVQVLPGAVPTLMSGPFIGIRGAPPGMVGSWYDGIELPYLFHLARGTAVVHPWLVESAALYAAGAPSRIGNAPGGAIEAVAAPPEDRLRASARIRLTESALGAEVPFANGRGSFLAAGRYSYTAPLVSLIAPEFALDYWDYQARARYELSEKDYVEAVSFGSGDVTGRRRPDDSIEEIFNGSFHRAALRYGKRGAGADEYRVGLVYGHDRWDANQSRFRPRSHTLTPQVEHTFALTQSSTLSWGASGTLRFQEDQYAPDDDPDSVAAFQRIDEQLGLWMDLAWRPTSHTRMTLGVRGDLYGSGTSPITRSAFEAGVGPRFLFSHEATPHVRLHNSFGYVAAPPSTGQRPPGRSFSVAGGLTQAFLSDAGVELSLPIGIKLDTTVFHNVYFDTGDVGTLRYLAGQLRAVSEAPGLARGDGQAYGLEVSLRRPLGNHLRGFLSYSLSRSTRTVGRVTGFAEFDRTHVLDAVLGWVPGKNWLISVRGSVLSGYPARVDSAELAEAPPRTEPYYQIDAQVSKRWVLNEHGSYWGFTVGLLNATLQKETNDLFCTAAACDASLVGPATIPTIGLEGEL